MKIFRNPSIDRSPPYLPCIRITLISTIEQKEYQLITLEIPGAGKWHGDNKWYCLQDEIKDADIAREFICNVK
jgi:hypothetical protein